jgi:hypothetical protein
MILVMKSYGERLLHPTSYFRGPRFKSRVGGEVLIDISYGVPQSFLHILSNLFFTI